MERLFFVRLATLRSNVLDRFWTCSLVVLSLSLAWYLIVDDFSLNFPVIYNGDSLFMLWLIKRLVDNTWYFYNDYCGFPFSSDFFDFPLSDSGNFLIIKFISFFSNNIILIFNIYLLLGFIITPIASYTVLQKFRVSKLYSFVGAILFTFAPFHFLRIIHIFYTFYFNIPLYFYISYNIFCNGNYFNKTVVKKSLNFLFLILLASFGVYYTFFGILLILSSGIAGSLKWKRKRNFRTALLISFILMLGIAINLLPNFLFFYKNGYNHTAVVRQAYETEVFGLKLVQMLLPQPNHRSETLQKITRKYNQTFPLVTENFTASLGIIGSIGIIILLIISITSPFFSFKVDTRLQLLSFLTIVIFLFVTIGGFSSIFAMLVTPLIRCWNRVSIYIAFASITAFILCVEMLIKKVFTPSYLKSMSYFIASVLLILGIWDQTYPANKENLNKFKDEYSNDQKFVKKIEQLIPNGAVYQLPYVSFPEEIINNNFLGYDLLRGYLNSSNLHWSSGGMKGRAGDLFFRELNQKSIAKQIDIIKKINFNGIYIDRSGFLDHGVAIENQISSIIGEQTKIVSANNNLVFYKLLN